MGLIYGTPNVTSIGARWRSVITIGLDTSYPAGGYTVNPIYMGLTSIEQLNATANEAGFIYDFITATGKLKVLAASGGALTVTGTNLPSAVTGTAAAQVWTAGAYTPAGTNGISGITGSITVDYQQRADSFPVGNIRIYTGAIAGVFPQVGASLVQAVTGASGIVGAFNGIPPNSSLDIPGLIIGFFDTTNLVTGTNPDLSVFTFTPTMIVTVWQVTPPAAAFSCFSDQSLNVIQQVPENQLIVVGPGGALPHQVRYRLGPSQLETIQDDGVTTLVYEYAPSVANTIASAVSAQLFTGTPAALTGTNAASALTATAAAQVWSGAVAGAASFGEVTPGTNLSAVNNLQIVGIGL